MDYAGKKYLFKSDARNSDIIAAVNFAAPAAVSQFKSYWNQNPEQYQNIKKLKPIEQIKKVWEIARINSNYKADELDNQNIKLPGAFLKIRLNDCKSFSTFIQSFLTSLGIKNGLKYVSYTPGAKNATHVYNYAIIDGVEIPVDGCLPTFGQKSKIKETFIKYIPMNVNVISGIENPRQYYYGYNSGIGKLFKGRIKTAIKKNVDTAKNIIKNPGAGVKNLITDGKGKLRGLINKAGQVVPVAKKISLAPGRAAFLGLVSVNFRNLAAKFSQVNDTKKDELKAFWSRLGGEFSKLEKAINNGKNKKRILGIEELEYISEPATAAAAITAAAPVLLAAINFLRKFFKNDKDLNEAGADVPEGTEPLGAGFEDTTPDAGAEPGAGRIRPTGNTAAGGSGFEFSTPVVIGLGLAAAGGLYLATKKKSRK
jgi:hypothetical protein